MMQHCNTCCYEFQVPLEKKVVGKYTHEDTCMRCLKEKEKLFTTYLTYPIITEVLALESLKTKKAAIHVWAFEDAPDVYQKMSNNGGDEDWLALVPPHIEYLPLWLENTDTCNEPQIYEISKGYKIIIGSHA